MRKLNYKRALCTWEGTPSLSLTLLLVVHEAWTQVTPLPSSSIFKGRCPPLPAAPPIIGAGRRDRASVIGNGYFREWKETIPSAGIVTSCEPERDLFPSEDEDRCPLAEALLGWALISHHVCSWALCFLSPGLAHPARREGRRAVPLCGLGRSRSPRSWSHRSGVRRCVGGTGERGVEVAATGARQLHRGTHGGSRTAVQPPGRCDLPSLPTGQLTAIDAHARCVASLKLMYVHELFLWEEAMELCLEKSVTCASCRLWPLDYWKRAGASDGRHASGH